MNVGDCDVGGCHIIVSSTCRLVCSARDLQNALQIQAFVHMHLHRLAAYFRSALVASPVEYGGVIPSDTTVKGLHMFGPFVPHA